MPPLDPSCLRLAAPHRALLSQLLAQHVPAADVWAYGSRVSGGGILPVSTAQTGCYMDSIIYLW